MSKFEWPLKHLGGKKIAPSRFFFFFFQHCLIEEKNEMMENIVCINSLMPLLNKKIIYKGKKIIGEENKQHQN